MLYGLLRNGKPVSTLCAYGLEVSTGCETGNVVERLESDKDGDVGVVSGDLEGEVTVWDVATRRPLQRRPQAHGRAYGVMHLAAIDRSKVLLSQGRDGFVKTWDLHTFGETVEPVSSLETKSQSFCKFSVLESRGWIACSGEEESDLFVWDLKSAQVVVHVKSPVEDSGFGFELNTARSGMCMGVKLMERNEHPYVLALYENGHVYVYDIVGNKWMESASLKVHDAVPIAFDIVSKKSKVLGISCGAGSSVAAFSVDLGKASAKVNGFVNLLDSVHEESRRGFSTVKIRSEDCRIFACGGWDGGIRLVEWKSLKPLGVLRQHKGPVYGLDFASKGRMVSGGNQHIALWTVYPRNK